jgi:hypothetical protein
VDGNGAAADWYIDLCVCKDDKVDRSEHHGITEQFHFSVHDASPFSIICVLLYYVLKKREAECTLCMYKILQARFGSVPLIGMGKDK